MFAALRKLFGRSPDEPAASPPLSTAPPRAPRFDEQLVPQLIHDHRELVHLYEQIGLLPERDRWDLLPAQLLAFKSQLEAHLLAENVRFYNYVEYTLRDDEENFNLIRDFRREMNAIARGVIEFVKKYQQPLVTLAERGAFIADYRHVGSLLVQRIEREEGSLYPLYQNV
ncbi:hemerythrin domain-containing protein [Tahibacter sp. UC22_41]|uniref:hemerythrin domain-containing protein n=1 Tax=Tahibacter sp. UC22_41 TaxID=3350178 RepID=UPI002D0762DA|nr:hemerythrin domain-containing protein [Tahibacter sp.]